MPIKVTPHLQGLVYDGALHSFWRKTTLRKFLRACKISENFLATWEKDESKREFLDRLFEKLPGHEKGEQAIVRMALFLAEQDAFPDLDGWEESAKMKKKAELAIQNLRNYLTKQQKIHEDEKIRNEARVQFRKYQEELQKQKASIRGLDESLSELSKRLGEGKAGYEFQDWFYDLMDYSGIVYRRPYWHGGREIDGSVTIGDTTYLVELKFTRDQATAPDVSNFLDKVNKKADNTMAVMISISGYSSVAKNEASYPRTPLLLLDHNHIYAVLSGMYQFEYIIERVRRHASQTGEAYLEISEF